MRAADRSEPFGRPLPHRGQRHGQESVTAQSRQLFRKAFHAKGRSGRRRTNAPGAGARASARSGAGKRRASTARRKTGRKTAGGQDTAWQEKSASSPKRSLRSSCARPVLAPRNRPGPRAGPRRLGGTGMERDLAQTPETGRSVRGPTNPMPTKRSTGTPAGAGNTRRCARVSNVNGGSCANSRRRSQVRRPASTSIAGRQPREADATNCRRPDANIPRSVPN